MRGGTLGCVCRYGPGFVFVVVGLLLVAVDDEDVAVAVVPTHSKCLASCYPVRTFPTRKTKDAWLLRYAVPFFLFRTICCYERSLPPPSLCCNRLTFVGACLLSGMANTAKITRPVVQLYRRGMNPFPPAPAAMVRFRILGRVHVNFLC